MSYCSFVVLFCGGYHLRVVVVEFNLGVRSGKLELVEIPNG